MLFLISLMLTLCHLYFSESYLVKWSKEGLAKDLDQLNNLRVLFTVSNFISFDFSQI